MAIRAPSRPLLAGLAAVVLVVGLAGCGDDDEPTATGDAGTTSTDGGSTGGDAYGATTGGGTGGEAASGTIVAADFSLTDVTVAPGEMIVLQNDGDQSHTATSDEDGLFDLEAGSGETSDSGTAPMEPGSYDFHCEIHPAMTATLTVEE